MRRLALRVAAFPKSSGIFQMYRVNFDIRHLSLLPETNINNAI